jgi:hypothetical protein
MTPSQHRVQANLSLTPSDADLLREAGGCDESTTEAVRVLVAEGLKWRMRHYTSHPLPVGFLMTRGSWREVVSLYAKVVDATATVAGVEGPLGNVCRFVEVPDDSQWHEPGRKTFMPLDENEFFLNGKLVRGVA